MPRGPHAADPTLFNPALRGDLRAAVADLSWLLSRGYAENSSLKIVGDRYRLRQRQRHAVRRCACTDEAVRGRAARRQTAAQLSGRPLAIDGFNTVIIVESALAGAVLLKGRDGALRDLASVHGNYRRVDATQNALAALCDAVADAKPSSVTWYLDRPVSNSGRLREWILDVAPDGWQVELPFDPDPILAKSSDVVATADANILDAGVEWIDLPAATSATRGETAWVVDLS